MTRAHETSLIRISNPSGAPVGRALSLGDHLGSTSVTTSDTGVKLAEMKYKPWGEVRSETGQTPSDYTFTGQYSHTDDFGLMFFNARWYDPSPGRFGQADSIVPGAGDPLAFDRYSYVRNSPASFVDPTGHYRAESEAWYAKPKSVSTTKSSIGGGECGPDGVLCLLEGEDLYNYLVENGWFQTPDLASIIIYESREGRLLAAWEVYEIVRRWLFIRYGFVHVDSKGKIRDDTLISLIITGEGLSGCNEAIEAISNQYHAELVDGNASNMHCGGDCTLEEQLAWLTDVEAWYRRNILNLKEQFESNLEAARFAARGYCNGTNCDSWMWGDILAEQLSSDGTFNGHIVVEKHDSTYCNIWGPDNKCIEEYDYWIIWTADFLRNIDRPWVINP